MLFPCGDSICGDCQPLDGGICPICYAPISKVVQARIADPQTEMFKNMKFSIKSLYNLNKMLTELVVTSEMEL